MNLATHAMNIYRHCGLLTAIVVITLMSFPTEGFAQRTDRNTELMIDEEFKVRQDGTLQIDVGDADVSIETAPGISSASVEIYLSGKDMTRAREYFDEMNFKVDQNGDAVSIESDAPKYSNWNWQRKGQAEIFVKVKVPVDFNLDVRSSDGDIAIDDVRGSASIRSSDGDLTLGSITGATIYISTSDGDIVTDDLDSDEIEVKTSDGDISLTSVRAEESKIESSDGEISVDALVGSSTIRTSDGDIRLGDIKSTSISVRTSDGDINANRLVTKDGRLSTSDGEIYLRYSEGPIQATASGGDIVISMAKQAALNVRSGDGDISIKLASTFGADLEVRGESVRLSRQDFTGTLDDHSASGSINGGGPLIKATAKDGNVSISN